MKAILFRFFMRIRIYDRSRGRIWFASQIFTLISFPLHRIDVIYVAHSLTFDELSKVCRKTASAPGSPSVSARCRENRPMHEL